MKRFLNRDPVIHLADLWDVEKENGEVAPVVVTVSNARPPIETRRCSVCHSFQLVDAFRVKQREYVRCWDCGLIFLKRIDPAEERAKYETGVYERDDNEDRLEFRKAVFEESLQEIARLRRPGRLLDVGCGNGLLLDLARKRGWETYGVELSPVASTYATEVLGLNVARGDLSEIRFEDSFFDVVTLYDVLCHLPSPLEQLIEIYRILKVGGLLVLRVRNATFHVGLVRFLQSLEPYLVFHLYCFTPKTIRYMLRKTGYSRTCVQNSALTPSDPYSISPVWGDRGMQAIKRGVYAAVEALYHFSARTLLLGPSLKVHATKGWEEERA